MASAKYFRFTKAASTGVQTVSGVGFTPKALILWSNRLTATGPTDGVQMLFGMTDGTDQACRSIHWADNANPNATGQTEQTDHLVYLTATGALFEAPAVQVAGQFSAFTADGVQIDWVTNDTAATVFHGIALGGDDVQVDYVPTKITVSSGGTIEKATSFRPDCFIVLGGAADEFGAGDYLQGAPFGSIHGFGFSNGTENACGWSLIYGGYATNEAKRGQHTDRCASIRAANVTPTGGELCAIQITGVSDTSFTVTRTVGSTTHQPVQHILAIRRLQFDIGSFSTPASSGAFNLPLDFKPTLLLMQTHGASEGMTTGASMSVGVWSADASGGTWIGGELDASPSVYASDYYTDAALKHRTPHATGSSSPVDIQATVTSVSRTGATMNFATVPASSATVIYIALASAATQGFEGLGAGGYPAWQSAVTGM